MVVAVDSSGNSRNATYEKSTATSMLPPTFVDGLIPAGGDLACKMANFTPPGDAETDVLIPNVPSTDAAWSFEAWVQLADIGNPSTASTLFSALDFVDGVALRIITDGSGFLEVNENGGNAWGVAGAGLDDFLPHYVVVTYDGAQVRIYVDGSELTLDYSGTPFSSAAFTQCRLGASGSSPTFYGTMDEAAWYTSTLTAGQITAHASAGSVSFAAYVAAVLADTPWAYYHLNEFTPASAGWFVGQIGMASA